MFSQEQALCKLSESRLALSSSDSQAAHKRNKKAADSRTASRGMLTIVGTILCAGRIQGRLRARRWSSLRCESGRLTWRQHRCCCTFPAQQGDQGPCCWLRRCCGHDAGSRHLLQAKVQSALVSPQQMFSCERFPAHGL